MRDGEVRDLEEIFDKIDRRRTGSVSRREFERVIEEDLRLDVSSRELEDLVDKFDTDGDGRIDHREFIRFCTEKARYRPGRGGRVSDIGSSPRGRSSGIPLKDLAKKLVRALEDEMRNGSARDMYEVFELLDRRGEGFIRVSDFERAIETDLRFRATRDEVDALVERFDRNRDGRVDYREFVRFCEDNGGYRRPPARNSAHSGRVPEAGP